MARLIASVITAILSGLSLAHADDGLGLRRRGNPADVSISGVSSGAALAVQYAVAHSKSIVGVGSIAGPAWGCANGSIEAAENPCMCSREELQPQISTAHQLAAAGKIDRLANGRPQALRRSYVFHSRVDNSVREQSAKANIAFLAAFIGSDPEVDWGDPAHGSHLAGHGIISPDDSNESCQANGTATTFIRRCEAEDNVGKMFHALYRQDPIFDPGKRENNISETAIWQFDQKKIIDQIKANSGKLTWDEFFPPFRSSRRQDFDLAATGYIYVPPSCRETGNLCRVHIALHGCKQDPKVFANKAGYNNWAEYYKTIIVYPAIQPSNQELTGEGCPLNVPVGSDFSWVEPNPNGCWDWWGYLDTMDEKGRYLTKQGPQIRFIERIIGEVTMLR